MLLRVVGNAEDIVVVLSRHDYYLVLDYVIRTWTAQIQNWTQGGCSVSGVVICSVITRSFKITFLSLSLSILAWFKTD